MKKGGILLHGIRKQWAVCKAVAFVTYKEWSAYRTHSMVSIFVGPVFFLIQYFIWNAVYGDLSTLGGIGFDQMIRYFGASVLIGYLTMDFADWNLSMLVRTGKFLTFALRPMNHRFFALSQKFGHRILGFFCEFVPCLLIFLLLFRVDLRPENWAWTILSIALAFLMNFYVHYALGMCSFWMVETSGIRDVFNLISGIFSGTLIPLVFFPDWLQKLQFFLPFQYTNYVPAMITTGQYTLGGYCLSTPQIVGIQALAVLAAYLLNVLLYKAAMKRFSGVGA